MLSPIFDFDSKVLWSKAQVALQTLNDKFNETIALVDEVDDTPDEEKDLVWYQTALDEAHVRQIRLTEAWNRGLSEKEMEINALKATLAEASGDEALSKSIDEKLAERIEQASKIADHTAMQDSLRSLRSQLEDTLRQRTEFQIKAEKLEFLELQLRQRAGDTASATAASAAASAAATASAAKAGGGEAAVEKLVEEYSQLAAESERRKGEDAQKIQTLSRQTETLQGKVAALQLAVNECTDPATAADATTSGAGARATLAELQTLKVKVASLEYDFKQSEKVFFIHSFIHSFIYPFPVFSRLFL